MDGTFASSPLAPASQKRPRQAAFGLVVIFSLSLCACQFLGKGFFRPAAQGTLKNPCIVLALPTSGTYSPVAAKIRRGAELAREELRASGTNVRLENINTEEPDWISRLSALPESCAIVGGPLRDKIYVQAAKSGILDKRIFFSFMSTLAKGDEGTRAWRFFPSPQDQVDALVGFVGDDLNIRSFGSFYPNDNYGKRMNQLLRESLDKKHISLRDASYNPGAPASWSASLRPLIQPTTAADGKTPIPHTTFEAIFLPDSWKNMDMLTTSLLYNGEDRLVLMGTTLWEQNLAGKQVPKAQKYSLAVFPGAWNSARAPKKLATPGNDFWVALGYDFINFATNVSLDMKVEAAEVTARARRAAGMIKGMAPISWDGNGVASQHLYLFQVGPGGMIPMNTASFRRARSAAQERAALRIQGLYNQPSASEQESPSVEPVSTPEDNAIPELPNKLPQSAGPAIHNPDMGKMSPVPRPSYKLRLPGK